MHLPTAPPTIGRRGVYILPSGTMFSGDFEAGEFASRGVIIYVDGGSYDGELDGRRSNPGPLDPHASPYAYSYSCSYSYSYSTPTPTLLLLLRLILLPCA